MPFISSHIACVCVYPHSIISNCYFSNNYFFCSIFPIFFYLFQWNITLAQHFLFHNIGTMMYTRFWKQWPQLATSWRSSFFLFSWGDVSVFDLAGELLFTISQVKPKTVVEQSRFCFWTNIGEHFLCVCLFVCLFFSTENKQPQVWPESCCGWSNVHWSPTQLSMVWSWDLRICLNPNLQLLHVFSWCRE